MIKVLRQPRFVLSLSGLLFLFVWEGCSRLGWLSAFFFPPPSVIGKSLYDLLRNGQLWRHLSATLVRVGLGFALGGFSGVVVGIMIGWSVKLRFYIDPIIAILHPIPKIAILPLVMVIFGIGEISKLITIGLVVFFPVVINTMTGIRQIDPTYIEIARNLGAGRWLIFTRILIPAGLPLTMAGIRLGLNSAFLITVAVELLASLEGMGALIWLAWQTFRIERLYVGLLTIAVLGLGFNLALNALSAAIIPWQGEHHER